eukprot:269219_1
MFKVLKKNNGSYSFQEDEQFGINLAANDVISFCEFDNNFKNVIMIINGQILEMRAVENINIVKKRIQLSESVTPFRSRFKQLSLSGNGNSCILAGGHKKGYAHFIDIENNEQTTLKSGKLGNGAYNPCFINGELIAIGGETVVEIWDVWKRKLVKSIRCNGYSQCTTSTNNILAVCTGDGRLTLYDVRNWEIFYTKKFNWVPSSLHLTTDSKYLTVAGRKGAKCVVLQIQ